MDYAKSTPTSRNTFRFLAALDLPSHAQVLDAGCGTGKLASFMQSQGHCITGIDLSDDALTITRAKGINAIKADILEGLPFEDRSFDLVYSDGLLEHFIDPKPVLVELSRLSRLHLLTFVPRISLYATVAAALLKPPKEYKRQDSEWIDIHKVVLPSRAIRSRAIPFGLLAVTCTMLNE